MSTTAAAATTVQQCDEFGRTRKESTENDDLTAREENLRDKLLSRSRRHRDDSDEQHRSGVSPRERSNVPRRAGPSVHAGMVVHGRVTRIEPYGAFVDFGGGGDWRNRGLVHISQLAPFRVDCVTDIVKMNQDVYCVILEIQENDRKRLSLIGVNQETGEYDPSVVKERNYEKETPSRAGPRGGSRAPPHLERRARQRLDQFHAATGSDTWRDAERGPGFLRQVWSHSPPPPAKAAASASKEKASRRRSDSSSSGSSSDSSSDSSSSSSESSSEDSRRRRRRHGSSRRNRDYSRRSRDSRRRRRRSYSSSSSESESSSSSSFSSASSSESSQKDRKRRRVDDDDDKPREITTVVREPDAHVDDPEALRQAQDFKAAVQGKKKNDDSDSDDDDSVGPQPLPQSNAVLDSKSGSYGKALLPGEGQAIAQYVQQNLRVPRRGEIGYTGDEIEQYEKSGYVMSGSRHARMNAVRIRKENQVYSAEEQRALALITMEEKKQKEAALMEDFRTMLKDKQKQREKGKGRSGGS